jgi:hypothetical protein
VLTTQTMRKLLENLNEALASEGEMGEIGMVGGAVMCLVYNARESTRDIDAIFEPSRLIRTLARKVAEANNISEDWLNDAAKAYIQGHFGRHTVLELSHLRIWAPEAKYMLAMKCISARWDSHDKTDVVFLIRHLRLKNPKDVFKVIESYYPKQKIPPKTQFLIEEIFEKSMR